MVPALSTPPHALAAGALALAASLALTPLVRGVARRWGLLDHPNARSSHRQVVPRGGGLAVAVATLTAIAAIAAGWPPGATGQVLLGSVVLAALGLWDDRRGLPPLARLGAQLVVAGVVVGSLGGLERLPLPAPLDVPLGALGSPVAVLWIVAVVNFFNFLDGIDGIAASQAAITAAGIALAAWDPAVSLVAAAAAGAALGFLPFNWSPASLFLGDVGSYFLGYTLAALPLAAPQASRSRAVLFVALSLWLFLADAAWTLARRAVRGERWYQAHREHLYQALALRRGHAVVTAGVAAGAVALTVLALAGWERPEPAWAWAGMGLAVVLFSVEWVVARGAGKG
jgi:UDP-N-acetylmuramyl pentapeptide phosphotransferase/UDP-N-acetylglucosamine-1-phosphate transferase